MNRKRILLVDDQSSVTRLLKLALQRKGGHIVREENDSTRACSAAREFQPDIVFCDLDMPNIDGGDVAQQLRSDPRLAHVPVIFLTALVSAHEAEKEIAGYPFLAKPVAIETILRCIDEQTAAVA